MQVIFFNLIYLYYTVLKYVSIVGTRRHLHFQLPAPSIPMRTPKLIVIIILRL